MAVAGISGLGITGTLSNGTASLEQTKGLSDEGRFMNLLQNMQAQKSDGAPHEAVETVSSSQIAKNHRLNGDYTQGFYDYYTSEADKNAAPEGMAAGTTGANGKKVRIDRTSDLYAQSKELENYMVKMMLSSMRSTIHHSDITGGEQNYARDMYEDMMYDNYAEQLTKTSHLGLADQIYIELSGQRG